MPFLMPDISSNNGPGVSAAEAKLVAKQAKALMVKSTEGATYQFSGFRSSESNARRAGLKTVAYHFVSASGSGVAQARYMWQIVKDSGVSALCIDWEQGSRQTAVDMLHELKSLAHGTGKRVGAYEGSWAREHGGGLPGCDFIIVPDYGVAALSSSYKLQPYAAWQYTDGAHNGTRMPSAISGIGHCDVSVVERPELIFGKPRRLHLPKRKPKPVPKAKPTWPKPHGWWSWIGRRWL